MQIKAHFILPQTISPGWSDDAAENVILLTWTSDGYYKKDTLDKTWADSEDIDYR